MAEPKVVNIKDWRRKKSEESIRRKAKKLKWATEQKIIKQCDELDW